MNIQSVKQHVSNKIYQRGKEYYEDDLIENVEREYPDNWSCEIEGTDIYNVNVELNSDEIISWECNCPYDGGICKHVVAFLIFIKANRGDYPLSFGNIERTGTSNNEILNNMNEKEMLAFMQKYAKTHPEFAKELKSHFLKETDDYQKEVDDCFKIRNSDLSYNRYGYSNEEEVIAYKIDDLISKKRIFVKNGQCENAVKTALYIMESIGDCYEEYQDYHGELASACSGAARFLSEIIEQHKLDHDLLDYITDELGELLKNNVFDNHELADINELLTEVSFKSADSETALKLLDEALEAEPDSFRTDSLVMSKVALLIDSDRTKEADDVITHYLYLPRIRKVRLKELVEAKSYDKAIQLIDEGIKLAEEKNHPGTISDWKAEKLKVYMQTNNTQKIIDIAEELFEDDRDSMNYFHILKRTVPAQNWNDYLQNTLLKKSARSCLPEIYIEEKYWDQLMNWAENYCSISNYNSIDRYKQYLQPLYPARILEFYRSHVVSYAERYMGRDHYQVVASVLMEMRTYSGGKELVDKLLADFRQKYARRPAMMQELKILG